MKSALCELCKHEASLYCASDSAFLCWNCDARVHQANFLVARHLRQPLCSKCKDFAGNCISGDEVRPIQPTCLSCSPENSSDEADSLFSSSSACISRTDSVASARFDNRRKLEKIAPSSSVTDITGGNSKSPARFCEEVTSPKKKKDANLEILRSRAPSTVDAKAEAIFVNWCRKLGLNSDSIVSLAARALACCLGRLTGLPFRVSLAASFWFALRLCGDKSASTWQNLRMLETISGVPAKLILAAKSKLARALRAAGKARLAVEEGWAECSV